MNKEVAMIWAAALESGDYKRNLRGDNTMRSDDNRFDVLGVLCNLHAQVHPAVAAMQTSPKEYMGENCELPEVVRKWAGMHDTIGGFSDNRAKYIGEKKYDSLAEAFDHGNAKFTTLAKAIRNYWEYL